MPHSAHGLKAFHARSVFLQRLQGSVLLFPPLLICVLTVFLLGLGQIKEVVIRAVEPQNRYCGFQLLLGFVTFALLAGTLFFSYLSACVVLRQAGIGYGSSLFYTSEAEWHQDRRIIRWRDAIALSCAAVPMAAIGYAFWSTSGIVYEGRTLLGLTVSTANLPLLQLCAADPSQVPAQLARIAASWSILAAVWLLTLVLYSRLGRVRRGSSIRWRVTRTQRHWLLTLAAVLVLLLPIPLVNWAPYWNEELFQVVGPLATLGLVLMSAAWLLFAIGEQSRKMGFPFLVVTAVIVFGFGFYVWATNPVPSDTKTEAPRVPTAADRLQVDFEAWLRSRRDVSPGQLRDGGQAEQRRPYAVYVLAAPGGGIYAASFVASVVSRLEADCPGFSQHIFAISAVSGGAIGSSIINAISRKTEQVAQVICNEGAPRRDPRITLVKAILSDDHLSATMASTLPDVIVKLLLIGAYELQRHFKPPAPFDIHGRAEALENSLKEAVRRACAQVPDSKQIPLCNDAVDGGPLGRDFSEHWSTTGVAPALVLNTTWAETGARIAFSPFVLAGIGDDTLKAMSELPQSKPEKLIEAAVASARFPAVLPAKIYRPGKLWWNFVDGGYADASGTTTALEIYKVIEQRQSSIEKNTGLQFDLKLLLLTESSNDPGTPSGAGLIHAISPITTLLTIREQISRRAVARAMNDLSAVTLDATATGRDCSGSNERLRFHRILLNTGTIGLPLGWMLSRHTADMIDTLVNEPDKVRHPAGSRGIAIANENRATFRAIKESLKGQCRDATGGR